MSTQLSKTEIANRFGLPPLKVIFGVLVPVVAFIGSAVFVPDYRGDSGAEHFLEMVVESKIFFWAPLILWAITAFLATQIITRKKYRRWEALGLWVGVWVAAGSIVAALLSPDTLQVYRNIFSGEKLLGVLIFSPFIIAPFYTLYWYFKAARKVSRAMENQPQTDAWISGVIFLPFVAGAVAYAQKLFEKLPDTPPDCYIVTAAQTAHPNLVKTIPNQKYAISEQLVLYKAVDLWLEKIHPTWHRRQRFIYDRLGPILAHWIRRKQWRANIAYCLLLPGQTLCRFILSRTNK